jgi:1-acyl-sn-glycerol-3-phosphate acyltransferase
MASFIVYTTFRFLFWVYFKLFHRLRISGRKNIPSRGAFLVASNHSSYFDPILLGVSTHRFLRYLARDTLFRTPFSAWVMTNVRSIPLKRQEGDIGTLRTSINILKKGEPLVIFPEGTRTPDGELKEAKRGIGFLVAKANVPVVPAYVGGTLAALPKWAKRPRLYPIMVYFDKPVSYAINASKGRNDDVYDNISCDIMDRISRLKARYEGETGQKDRVLLRR